ncbi:hypothetical protein [Pontimicrobium sp. MEBiC06410]
MKFIKSLFTLLFLFNCFFLFSQESITELYLDENLNEIDSISYSRKCKRILSKCLKYKTDSLVINKVLIKYAFGKLTPNQYNQIKGVITRNSNIELKQNEVLVIKYYDSLFSFNSVNRRHLNHLKKPKTVLPDSLANAKNTKNVFHTFNESIFNENRKKWVKKHKKCIEKNEKKYDIKLIYLYKAEQNVLDQYEDFNWVKDNGVFKNKFFKIMFNFHLLIIKPDGDYFLSGGHITDKQVGKLLKKADWSKYKNDWKLSFQREVINGYGLFKKTSSFHHKKHCF